MSKSIRIQLEVDVHAVTCPGVWFPCKSPVYLSICFLGFHVRTKPFPANFPLLFNDKFVFEKTFPGVATLHQLQATLEHQPLYVELLQEISPNHPPAAQNVMATFETSGLEFLFPYPQLRPTYTSGVDVDLLMEPTRDFPGVIAPRIEASTRTHIAETRNAHLDLLHDNAVTIDQPPPMDSHPHLPPGNKTRRKSSTESREIFAWRKYDNLLDRTPGDDLHHLPPTGPPPPPPGPPTHPPHPPHGPPEGMGIRGRSKSFSFPPGRHRSRESTSSGSGNGMRGRPPHKTPPGHGPMAHPPHPRPVSASPPPRGPPPAVHRDYHPHHPPHRHGAAPLPVPPPVHPPAPPPPVAPPPHVAHGSHPPGPPHRHIDAPHHYDPHLPPTHPAAHPHPPPPATHPPPHLPPPPPNIPPSYHPHHAPVDGPHHHHPPHEYYHEGHGAHCLCGRDHQHPPFEHGFYHHPTCPPGCGVNHCHPYPLCLDPVTCPYSCHVESHPHYPLPPSSTPHIHSRNFPHRPHAACYDGVCCHS